jgi:hypothetical protein
MPTEAEPMDEPEPVAEAEPMPTEAEPEDEFEPMAEAGAMAEPGPMADVSPATGAAATAQEGFEPTAHDELRAEQEARAAIQDAFTEHTEPEANMSNPMAFATRPADAAAEERRAEPVDEAAAEPAAEAPAQAIQEAFGEPIPSFSKAAIDDAGVQAADLVDHAKEPTASGEPAAQPTGEAIHESIATAEPPVEAAESTGAAIQEGTEAVPGDAATARTQAGQAQSGEEELMWLGDEFEEASLEIATQGWRSADAPARPPETPVLELSDAELAQLAADEGWDAAEVEAIRSLLGRPTAAAPQPAAAERPVAEPPPAPTVGGSQSPAPAEGVPPIPPRRHSMSSMSDPQWLKGRRGPAATAYRRLRRIFPG